MMAAKTNFSAKIFAVLLLIWSGVSLAQIPIVGQTEEFGMYEKRRAYFAKENLAEIEREVRSHPSGSALPPELIKRRRAATADVAVSLFLLDESDRWVINVNSYLIQKKPNSPDVKSWKGQIDEAQKRLLRDPSDPEFLFGVSQFSTTVSKEQENGN